MVCVDRVPGHLKLQIRERGKRMVVAYEAEDSRAVRKPRQGCTMVKPSGLTKDAVEGYALHKHRDDAKQQPRDVG